MSLETYFLFAGSVKAIGCGIIVLSLISLLVLIICYFDCWEKGKQPTLSKLIKVSISFLFIGALISIMPTKKTFIESRLAVIKLSLMEEKNITKAVDKIDEIAKKLECKYLGCDD